MGANNAFWGKNHSPETKALLKVTRKARKPIERPPGANRFGPLKGAYKNSPEARAKISAAVKEDWRKNRDKRLAACAKAGETQRMNRINPEPRYRLHFTPMQRRDWIEGSCKWCDATDDLVLDHILPVMAGGGNKRSNCQTLCRKCNLWKMRYIDRPLVLAILDSKGADYNPEYQSTVDLLLV
jgi:5-methylcytosine-specific restriction endonuclease McrA